MEFVRRWAAILGAGKRRAGRTVAPGTFRLDLPGQIKQDSFAFLTGITMLKDNVRSSMAVYGSQYSVGRMVSNMLNRAVPNVLPPHRKGERRCRGFGIRASTAISCTPGSVTQFAKVSSSGSVANRQL